MVFKILTGKVSIDRRDLFTLLPSHTRGAKSKLRLSKARTSVRSNFFSLRASREVFCFYTYDLPHLVELQGVKCKMFADDVKIYNPIADNADTVRIQVAIDEVVRWSNLWGLPLASDKTSVLRLGRSTSHNNYYIGGSALHNVNQVRDLGFIIDNACTLRIPVFFIRAYKTFVRSILEYGSMIFFPHSKKSIYRLEAIQNSFTRKVLIRALGSNYKAIPRGVIRNKMLGLDSLLCRRKKLDLLMVFKILTGKVSIDRRDLFTLLPSHTRGAKSKLRLSKARTSSTDVNTVHELIVQLARTISCGGNYLLNVGPDMHGKIPPIFEDRLRELGR
ncbi:hypothetical protein COOONC_28434, partial [Cooperia oncophora]